MRVAIVGCGQISRMHVDALHEIEGVQICAVSDRDQQRARQTADRVPDARVYGDLATLLGQERPEVIHILTPPQTHAGLAILAMEAGCHVLVEKPMALSVREANSMVETARRSGVKLSTNHNYLFKPSILKARELVASGTIGEVVYVDSFYGLAGEGNSYAGAAPGSHWAWRLPGGAFTNFLPHLIYLQLAFLRNVEAVSGVALNHGDSFGGLATELMAVMQGASASGIMSVSMRAKPYAKFVDIYGTRGILHADLVREVCTVHRERQLPRMLSKALFSLEDSLQLASGTAANTLKVATGRLTMMPELRTLVREFYASIQEGRDPPVSGEDGLKMVRVMEMVWEKYKAHSSHITMPASSLRQEGPRTDAERAVVSAGGFEGKVLVTGATGFLGRHLVAALSRVGADVVALVRDRSRVPLDVERLATLAIGDISSPASLQEAMRGVGVVFHCAAVTSNSLPWSTHQETNVAGTQAVFDAALEAGVRRVVHVSSVVVYGLDGRRPGPAIAENTTYTSSQDHWAYYLRSKLAGDKLAFQYLRDRGLPVTVLRLGILYGPGKPPVGKGLMQLGSLRLTIGDGRNILPFTYVENAVDSLLLAAIVSDAVGQAYNIVDEPQVSVHEAMLVSQKVGGDRTRSVPLPSALLSGAALLLETRARRAGSKMPPKLSRYVVRSAARNLRYDTTKAREQLGWKPEVGLWEGVRRSLGAVAEAVAVTQVERAKGAT